MMAKGLMARSDNNAGTKKSPLQIQMLERFYSGEFVYMLLLLQALFLLTMLYSSIFCCG
jgi:hypothetical protein